MLSFDEHPGIVSFLIGIIVLVMVAVGLSVVIDRRLTLSSGMVKIQREITLEALELEELTARHHELSSQLDDSGSKQQAGSGTGEGILVELETLRQRHASLQATRKQLRDAMSTLEADFSRYRAEYRRRTWMAAVGERLGNLAIRGGRSYQEATITRVTEVGLEIRHTDGIARIQAPDLDQKMQDRFQWNDEDRRKVLKEEMDSLQGGAAESVTDVVVPVAGNREAPVPVVSNIPPEKAPGSPELKALRRLVVGWQSKVSNLRSDRKEALARSGYGSQTSVPGSLETWDARAARIGNELGHAQVALATAKANLAAVAPDDPLLGSVVSDP